MGAFLWALDKIASKFWGLSAENLCSAFVAALRYNLFAQRQQKGFALLSASPSEEYLFSTFIEAKVS